MRFRQFTLSSLLVATAILAFLLGQYTKQSRIIGQLHEHEVEIEYLFQFKNFDDAENYTQDRDASPPFLAQWLGPDAAATAVKLWSHGAEDPSRVAELAAQLPHLRSVAIQESPLNDNDLQQLVDLRELRALYLRDTWITDQAIVSLREMTNLRVLNICNTALSDSAIETLEKSLPNTRIHSGPAKGDGFF